MHEVIHMEYMTTYNNQNTKRYVAIYQNEVYTFDKWKDCQAFVADKKDIKFKGFTDDMDIKKFIDDNIKKVINVDMKDTLYAYVYGMRYNYKDDYLFGWSYTLLRNHQIIYSSSGIGDDCKIVRRYKTTGEIAAIMNAIEYALSQNEKRIIILFDFLGAEMWANGSWKPKTEDISNYVEFMQQAKKRMAIDFVKVNKQDEGYQLAMKNCKSKYQFFIKQNILK